MGTAVSLSVQRRSLLLWLSLVLAGAGAAQAEDRALLVGVGTYQDGSTLLGGSRDLDSMRQIVAKLGFGPQQIRVLADRAATRQGLLGSIQSWLVEGVTAGDRVLFYFVGHGTRYTDPAGQNGCSTGLVPYDLANVVGERDLQAAFNRVPAREMLVILDSCFSGVNYRGGAAAAPARALQPRFLARSGTMACTTAVNMTPDNRISRILGPGRTDAPATGRSITMTASANNELAFGSDQGGLFTQSLYQGLVSRPGPISFAELREFAAQHVRKLFAELDVSGYTVPTPQLFGVPEWLHKDVFSFGRLSQPATATIPSPDIQAATSGRAFLDRYLNTSAFAVEVRSKQAAYRDGEPIEYTVVSSSDGYLNLFELDERGALTLLYPNRYAQANNVKAGVPLVFPDLSRYRIVAGAPYGKSQVVALVSDAPLNFMTMPGSQQTEFQLFLSLADIQRLGQQARASLILPVATGARHGAGSVTIDVRP
ncbi:DUF4384 domain-containing protein [Deinococcus sp. NW-56]|uniref:DUF4384 domain-containing protein n=1 Tax=Deinococcus sp. NW-56 TaxID=2080419 RepID=UPI001319B95C|nr:DUF4384 domain-containing protein [Deinococcus sp. NW-56]